MDRINWMEFAEWVPGKIDTVLLPLGTLEPHGVTANGTDIFAPGVGIVHAHLDQLLRVSRIEEQVAGEIGLREELALGEAMQPPRRMAPFS